MKKLLLLLAVLPIFQSKAQTSILFTEYSTTVTIATNGTIVTATSAGVTESKDIDITNTSSTVKKYLMRTYNVVLNSGAEPYYCFAGNCFPFPAPSTSPDTLTLQAGTKASDIQGSHWLTVDLKEGPTVGYSLVKYTIYDVNNPGDSAQLNFQYNAAMGLNEVKNAVTSAEIFPNPSNDNTTLLLSSSGVKEANILLINSLGSKLSEKHVLLTDGRNKIDLNTENLSTGIYFIVVKSGNASITKKMVIK
jgi:hypothetical protein